MIIVPEKLKYIYFQKKFIADLGSAVKNPIMHLMKRSFADASTRKHNPGNHKITIIANGVEKASTDFELTGK